MPFEHVVPILCGPLPGQLHSVAITKESEGLNLLKRQGHAHVCPPVQLDTEECVRRL